MKKKYKVIIVGAGPAGLSTAINLKNNGVNDILVIEREVFPRYKCCAGYITNKTKLYYEKLGLDISKCHYNLIEDFNIFYKLKLRQNINNKFLYTNEGIERVELDYEFYKLACSKNIEIRENDYIIKSNFKSNTIILKSKRKVTYDYLVFADGTSGYGSKLQKNKNKNIALQQVFKSNLKDGIEIHFGITKRGYAWVSTNNGITNIGITDVYDPKINYKNVFNKFVNDLKMDVDLNNLKGAFTPIGVKKPIIYKNVYFVGDVVGACDPLTLSGLRYALSSGEYCAKAIAKNNTFIYKRYIKNLKIRFLFMQLMQKVFYLKMVLFMIFNIGCKFFNRFISYVFNHFFVNEK